MGPNGQVLGPDGKPLDPPVFFPIAKGKLLACENGSRGVYGLPPVGVSECAAPAAAGGWRGTIHT